MPNKTPTLQQLESILKDHVMKLSNDLKTDILVYHGSIEKTHENEVENCCLERKNENALLLLTTYGGDPHAAYRIARCLQNQYNEVTIFINTYCKSAGTLLALGANNIIMSDSAELGPIDIQLRKQDELGERSSGLTTSQSFSFLQTQTFNMFEEFFLQLRFKSNLQISTKSASEIATNLTIGMLRVWQKINCIYFFVNLDAGYSSMKD
ncbi:MAG: hypothetical protein PF482_10250 [Desulfobacteraceae bacterium]|jgi:hypothetical protein|nr:hypothetical protein [Desulfobacteraceae bacterium]